MWNTVSGAHLAAERRHPGRILVSADLTADGCSLLTAVETPTGAKTALEVWAVDLPAD